MRAKREALLLLVWLASARASTPGGLSPGWLPWLIVPMMPRASRAAWRIWYSDFWVFAMGWLPP
eukprot:5933180-Heterocapsa_arctica.AAC.1